MAEDDHFDGYSHPTLPSVDLDFSVKSSAIANQPEVVVDIKNDGQWVRLPVTNVETRINKDGPADLSATSRVDCPVTWGSSDDGKADIYEYVGETRTDPSRNRDGLVASDSTGRADAEFDVARVFYWNQYNETYSVEQFGYVAAIGPGTQDGTFRFYVYDPADLMGNISVTKTYDEPTASGVANFIAYDAEFGLEENSPIPIRAVSTTGAGEIIETEGSLETFRKDVVGWINDDVPIIQFDVEPTGDGESQFIGTDEWVDEALHAGGHKHFRRNKHTLVDVMNWLTDEIGGSWYFEPVEDGVVLVVNNGVDDGFSIARSAYYDGQFQPNGLDYIQGNNHVAVDVINNTSLEDLKPINHLVLNGESQDSFLGINTDRFDLDGPIGAARGHTDKYPHVEVTYPPLLERAGGNKLGPPPIESGKQTLAEAEQEAVQRFKEAHQDNTDGSIEIRALPTIRPYDYMAAVPVCNDTFDARMDPIQYEVNSVRHKASAKQEYMTSLGVSLALDEEQLIVRSSNVDIDPSEET